MNSTLKHKSELYKKGKSIVNDFLDISNIFNKLEEFKKFKIVLLKSEQLALFNFISKELISLYDRRLKSHSVTYHKMFENDKENMASIILGFREKMKNNLQLEEIDKKLYNFLNDEFK